MVVSTEIDTSRLNLGIQKGLRWSHRTPAQVVNTCACEVAIVTKNTTPFVEVATIDEELGTVVTAIIGARGRPLSTKKAGNRLNLATKTVPFLRNGVVKDVPLAVLIVQARANPNSNYNQSTGWRYALTQSPFKGLSRAMGAFKMTWIISNMIAGRHRSTHFLMSMMIPAVKMLLPLSNNRWRRGSGASAAGPPLEGNAQYFGGDTGGAIRAREGALQATCIIYVNPGGGKNAASIERAIQAHIAPAMQSAVYGEGTVQMDYACRKAAEELEKDVARDWV